MDNHALEPESVSIPMDTMEAIICNGSSQPQSLQQQEASMLTHLKKVENQITDAQRFSHLPKRSAVDLDFIDLSYTIQEGPCWRRRESSLQAALHQSVFLSAMSPQPGRDLSLCWEQHSKLLPGVAGVHAKTVSDFIESLPGCEEQAKQFRDEQIDGRAFLLLTQRDIVRIMSIKLGPALKIYNSILMFKHAEDRNQSQAEDRSQSHAKDRSQSHTQDGSQSHAEDSSQSHTKDRSQSYGQDGSQFNAQDRSQSHTEDRSQSHTEPYQRCDQRLVTLTSTQAQVGGAEFIATTAASQNQHHPLLLRGPGPRSGPGQTQEPGLDKYNDRNRRSEVVVVKGKLKLISVSGLVAALGILVLLVGVVMAALGYWPRDGLFFSVQPQKDASMTVSFSSSTPTPAQGEEIGEKLGRYEGDDLRGGGDEDRGGGIDKDGGGGDRFNRTEVINGTTHQLPQGFLEDFLNRYLYSDRLKVFGPLIMGIGIFLFICANAVLHENRDKKTKVINLRDIYSTVIDLHSLRKPNTSSVRRSSISPLNGLVNYVQSKSLETKPRAYPASLLNRREGGGGGGSLSRQLFPGSSRAGGGGGSDERGGDTVFSIYQDQPDTPSLSSFSHRLSLPPRLSPPHLFTHWTPLQKVSSFTLPLRHSRPLAPRRRHSARAGTGWCREGGQGGQEERRRERRGHKQEKEEEVFACPLPSLSSSTPLPLLRPLQGSSAASCSTCSLHQEAPGGSQALLLLSSSSLTPSHLSLSSLYLLSSSPSTLPPPAGGRACRPPAARQVTVS
ncbi:Transmembrane protein 200C [Collichthys lucidus]|uniref:Transmembrane protein 200C n=1 Tax=Collichthys lucidus TaxID=240159 RepID=A0A4U5VGD6_COLLU|nr:Transmembrane protein 200C [Collichthys lucidus]